MEIEEKIREFVLENAIKFNGKASQGAIVGKIMALDPSLKSQMKEIAPKIGRIIGEVNALSLEEQKEQLLAINPDFDQQQQEKKQQRKAERQELPELPNAVEGKVITRMPPEPSKYNHLGHALSFLINYLYAKKYKGKCILRFDDTNPEKETQEFVDAMHSDVLDYLDIKPDEIVFASDDMEKFYAYAKQLLEKDLVYITDTPSDQIAKQRRDMQADPNRNRSPEENKELWKQMLEGKHEQAVMRLKIAPDHKNAVMRDPVIYRVVNTPHYRQGKKYHVWPMYDFESAVEEGIHGITHVMRSNEFDSRIELQHHIAQLLGFGKVEFKHYGRFNITGATTQGREIREGIERGEYMGWDDPRLVTLRALKRRGIVKETYYELVAKSGMSKTQTNLDITMLTTLNKQILDAQAKRFFLVLDPLEIEVQNAPEQQLNIKLHPEYDLGTRSINVGKNYVIEKKDAELTGKLRLIDNSTIEKTDGSYVFVAKEFQKDTKQLIHYLPNDQEQIVDVEIMMPDTTVIKGKAEKNLASLNIGEVVQFHRHFYARLDAVENNIYKFWFTHD